MIDVTEIRASVDGHGVVRSVDKLPRGHVRIETELSYPDGSYVDVFVKAPLTETDVRLSDLGQTTTWLLDLAVRPWQSKTRQRLLEDAIQLYEAEQVGGAIELVVPSRAALVKGVIRLAQACVRVADLYYTRRMSYAVSATDELEEFLSDADLSYKPNAELNGMFAPVKVDFLVAGERKNSALLMWSSANNSQAHQLGNEIFRKWYDLNIPARTEQRVTVFDDRYDTYRKEDFARVRSISDLVAFSDKTTLRDLLTAA